MWAPTCENSMESWLHVRWVQCWRLQERQSVLLCTAHKHTRRETIAQFLSPACKFSCPGWTSLRSCLDWVLLHYAPAPGFSAGLLNFLRLPVWHFRVICSVILETFMSSVTANWSDLQSEECEHTVSDSPAETASENQFNTSGATRERATCWWHH